jgi:hypothetical protein
MSRQEAADAGSGLSGWGAEVVLINPESWLLRVAQPGCGTVRVYYNHQRPHLSLRGLTPVQRRQTYFAQTPV